MPKQKKPHYYYLDLIRISAIGLIVLEHLIYQLGNFKILQWQYLYFFGFKVGDLGVSLFIFLSGVTLTLSSLAGGGKLDVLNFYMKRLFRLYPLFWLIYLLFFIYYRIHNYLPTDVPIDTKILAFIGMDGYMTSFIKFPNWYLVGEWFFGFIVILYFLYPILYKLFIWNKYLFITISFIITTLASVILKDLIPNYMRLIPIRLLEFSAGMMFSSIIAKSSKKIFPKFLFISAILFLLASLMDINVLPFMLFKLLIFDMLVFSASFFIYELFRLNYFKSLVIFFSNISLSVYITHHILIYQYIGNFRNFFTGPNSSMLIVIHSMLILLLIFIFSTGFYYLEKMIMNRKFM